MNRGSASLLAVLVVAVAVRVAGLQHESFTMDEVTELQLARGTVGQIVVQADGFPPLYSLLLKGWLMAWPSPAAARWLSALLGVLAVVVMYRVGLETGGPATGLAAAGLLAVSPLHVWFSQEARAYPLAFLLAALIFWRFARAMRTNGWRDWMMYAFVAAAGLYAHYYIGLLVGLHGVWTLGTVLRGREPGPPLAAHAVLGLLAVPVLVLLRPDLAAQMRTLTVPFSIASAGYTLYAFLLGFSTGLSIRELHTAGLREALLAFLPWLVVLGICIALIARPAMATVRHRPATAAYVAGMVLLPIILCGVLAEVLTVKYNIRYIVWASIPLTLVLAQVGVEGWPRSTTRVAAGMYLLLALSSIASRHLVDDYRNEDLRSLAAYLAGSATPGLPILVVPDYMADPVRFYLGPDWPVRGLAAFRERVDGVTRPFRLVYTRAFDGDPDGRLRRYLDGDGIGLEARFTGVELYRADGPLPALAGPVS